LKDIHPDVKDGVMDLLSSWEGTASEEKLKKMLGQEKTKSLLGSIKDDQGDL
jgi:hypothetical protein